MRAGARAGRACGFSMRSVSYFVDDSGRLWDINSSQLRAELYGFAAADSFPEYVVKNLGFVRIDRRGPSATVWLRPATVAQMAVAHLMYWLVDEKIERVLVNSYVDGAWQHAMVGAAEKSFTALAALISAAAHTEPTKDAVIACSTSLTDLPASSPLADALQLWREMGGDWRRLASRSDLGAVFGDRYALFERRGERDFVLKQFGDGLPDCAKVWLGQAIGMPIHDHPDPRYGWSCTASYRKVLDSSEPELQDVDAYVSWPGAQRQRRRYKRLLLPLSAGDRCNYLLSATAEDGTIDLRAAS